MGLSKKITLDNGAVTNYHRIARIEHLVGQETGVTVYSYTSQAKRKEELKTEGEDYLDTRIAEQWYQLEFDDTLTVKGAYEYLKTLDEFGGAKDALDD